MPIVLTVGAPVFFVFILDRVVSILIEYTSTEIYMKGDFYPSLKICYQSNEFQATLNSFAFVRWFFFRSFARASSANE